MKVIWLPRAFMQLNSIYAFYERKNLLAANRLYNKLLGTAAILSSSPLAGAREPLLEDHQQEFRFLIVEKKYKLIYFVEGGQVKIAVVWCCLRNVNRLKHIFDK